jgi:uncharacterized repeat protein (TIGR02543 family)
VALAAVLTVGLLGGALPLNETHQAFAASKKVKVTFKANGGKIYKNYRYYAKTTKKVTKGKKLGATPKPTRSGYTFSGWYSAKSSGKKYTGATKIKSKKTLYAHWKRQTTSTPTTKPTPTQTPKPAPTPTQTPEPTPTPEPVAEYTVYFNANGGNVNTGKKTVKYNAEYGSLPTPTLSDHEFLGWFTEQAGGIQIVGSTTVAATADHTLYAHWRKTSVTVNFDPNGGDISESKKTVKYGGKYGTLPTPTRFDHGFLGWFTDPTAGVQIGASTAVTATADHTLYAHWQVNPETWLADMTRYEWTGDVDAFEDVIGVGRSYTDNHGAYHYYGYVGNINSVLSSIDVMKISTVTYDIDGAYETFVGKLGVYRDYYRNHNTTIKIYGDNKLLWTSLIVSGNRNVDFSIDVKGIKYIKFERTGIPVENYTGDLLDVGFMDSKFIR